MQNDPTPVMTIREQIIQRIVNTNDQHKATLRQHEIDTLTRYPLSKFVEIFLPMFSGAVEQDDYLLSQWLQIAGDNTRAVHLIDDAGNIVDRVPPLAPVDMYDLTPTRRVSLADQLGLIERGAVRDPDTHTYNAGMMLLKDIKSPERLKAVQQQWIDLIKRVAPGNAAKTATDPSDDMWEY